MNADLPNVEEMLSRILSRVSLMIDEKFASYQASQLEKDATRGKDTRAGVRDPVHEPGNAVNQKVLTEHDGTIGGKKMRAALQLPQLLKGSGQVLMTTDSPPYYALQINFEKLRHSVVLHYLVK